jgi:8-oxo-dGTP diphosphatase
VFLPQKWQYSGFQLTGHPPMTVSETEYLASYNIHDFDIPLTSVDVVIFTLHENKLKALIVKRAEHPFMHHWALPGGFSDLQLDDSIEQTAYRKLFEKTQVSSPYLEQLETVGNNKRDPRGWSTTIVYFALIASDNVTLQSGSGTSDVKWLDIETSWPQLAFDHAELLKNAITRLRNKVEYTNLPLHLLPQSFTLSELQNVFEIVLGRKVDKSAFRRRIREAALLEEIPGKMRLGNNRPAQMYQAKAENYCHYFSRNIIGKTTK